MQDSQQKKIDTLKNLFEAVLKQNGSAITKAQLKMKETIEMWKITMKESYNEYNRFRAEVNEARKKMAELLEQKINAASVKNLEKEMIAMSQEMKEVKVIQRTNPDAIQKFENSIKQMKYPLASNEMESVTAQVTSLAHDLAEVKVKSDESLSQYQDQQQ